MVEQERKEWKWQDARQYIQKDERLAYDRKLQKTAGKLVRVYADKNECVCMLIKTKVWECGCT